MKHSRNLQSARAWSQSDFSVNLKAVVSLSPHLFIRKHPDALRFISDLIVGGWHSQCD